MLNWLGKGKKIEDILLGVHQSIAGRSTGLAWRVGIEPEVTFTGGVAKNIAMIESLEKAMGMKVNVSDDSHYMGALGAALFALDHIFASRTPPASRGDGVRITARASTSVRPTRRPVIVDSTAP